MVSADEIARKSSSPAAGGEICAFGDEVLNPDGTLNRRRLGAIVFADEARRRRLERITHPRIREVMARRIEDLAAGGTPVIAETRCCSKARPASRW